jgi:hypothetical protein
MRKCRCSLAETWMARHERILSQGCSNTWHMVAAASICLFALTSGINLHRLMGNQLRT